jgi:hypothetical protein
MKRFSNNVSFAAALAFVVLLSGCSAVKVDYNPTANFSQYKSFAWLPAEVKTTGNPLYKSSLTDQRVRQSIEAAFAERGIFRQAGNPDFLVGYHYYVEQKTRQVPTGYGVPFYGGWGFRPWGWGWGMPYYGGYRPYATERYDAGTLVVDIVDARTNDLVWRGSFEEAVSNPAALTRQLSRQVAKIMDKYPVRATTESRS